MQPPVPEPPAPEPPAGLDPTRPLRVIPSPRARPWGSGRLGRAPGGEPIGEVWLAGPDSAVEVPAGGAACTLDDLAQAWGRDLVGEAGMHRYGRRFPLLVKVIEAASFLSVQVHPDDALAQQLAGPDAVGKHEAWVIAAAEPGASLLLGAVRGASGDAVRAGIAAGGTPPGLLRSVAVAPGMILDVPPGTIHAIGPGIRLVEVQQPSDLTYRISDWDRRPTPERPLHTTEALAAVDPASDPLVIAPDGRRSLATDRFELRVVEGGSRGRLVRPRPGGASPHVVVAVDGELVVEGPGGTERVAAGAAVVVPAAVASYALRVPPATRAVVARAR